MPKTLIFYFDYKSPYAFLAKDRIYALADESGAVIDWRPYVLEIPNFLGSATVGADGAVIEADRTPHQWRRVRYLYMDCRRLARKQGLVLRSPRKIWDSSAAAAGMLFAQQFGPEVFRRYHDIVFERFWERNLDIEAPEILAAVLTEAGGDGGAFPEYLPDGLARVDSMSRAAEAEGVFGVPTFILNGEMFWGGEHLPDIRAMLSDPAARGAI